MTGKLQIYCHILLYLTRICTSELWKGGDLLPWEESEDGNQNAKKPVFDFIEHCKNMENCPRENDENKRMFPPEEVVAFSSSPVNEPLSKSFPAFVHKQPRYCSCAREKRLVDLGPNYFPRYYSDMVCLDGGCGSFSCSPKRFKLWVLRKRREADLKPGSEPVPNELRDHWLAENVITTIDCECMP